jgi:low affinity Fe/Cu permease
MTSKAVQHTDHVSPTNSNSLAAHFAKFAQATAQWTGHPAAFLLALAVIAVWIVSGPVFNYSDTWQLVINTGTTIITFLMVFLIQNTQNRDILTVQLKLSELVLAMKGAKNEFAAIEDLTDDELQELHDDCRARVELMVHHIETRRSGPQHKPRAAAQRAKSHRQTAARAAKS